MRSVFGLAAVLVSFAASSIAYSQNALRGGGQPAANAPAGAAGGAEEVPTGQFGPGQPGAAPGGQAQPGGTPAGVPGAPQPGGATDPNSNIVTSYALGRNFAMSIKADQVNADLQALIAGISDVLTGAQPRFTEQQCQAAMQRLQQEIQQKMMAKMRQDLAKNQQEEAAFLAQNAKRTDVQTLPSGVQYRVLQQGQGAVPAMNDVVKCNYSGKLLNGTEFDSSARGGGPAEFSVKGGPNGLIAGWVDALLKMHVGDKWQIFVPAKSAYGSGSPGAPIEPGSMLVFEIELLEVVAAAPQK